jgi:hypothetical protein
MDQDLAGDCRVGERKILEIGSDCKGGGEPPQSILIAMTAQVEAYQASAT